MLKLKAVTLAVAGALGGTLVHVPAAQAQSGGTQALDRVQVTGSFIKRIEGETALPVVTLSVEELTRAGVTNAEQAVKMITQQQGGTVSSGSVSSGNGGASYASLRNLGPQRTLVLLNGRRIVSNPFQTVAVDLNTLPMAAISRVEVLTDGASAVYGTDAIAGVINFITRRDFAGVQIGAETQIPQEDGGRLDTASLIGGIGSLAKQGWNVYGGFNYRKQEPMFGTDRDFSARSYDQARGWNATSPTTFPANWTQTVAGTTTVNNANPSAPGCQPPTSLSLPWFAGSAPCNADTQGFTWTIPEQEQWSGFLRGSLALGADHTVSLEYFRSYNRIGQQIAPSPENGLAMSPASPFYPGNGIYAGAPGQVTTAPVTVNWRTTELGARKTDTDNTTQRAMLLGEGRFGAWDYQASALWSKSEIGQDFLSGYGATAALLNGMAGTNGAPFLNPFGPQTAAGAAFLRSTQITGRLNEGEGTLQSMAAVFSRQFGQLAGGPMSVALAGEFRTEEMVYITDVARASQTSSSGIAGSAPRRSGDRDISALGAEALFPVMKNLELGLAVRWDDYSDFGQTTNPKYSFKWTPTRDLLVRGSYNTGFAAPTLTQLFIPNQTTFTSGRYNDPVLCPGGTVAPGGIASRDCGIQFTQLTGGNDTLQPEESKAYTLGFVMQATAQISFGADFWKYRITDNIGTLGEATIFGNPTQYAARFIRCSQAPADRVAVISACRVPGGDPLAYIVNTNENLGETEISGVDLSFNWQGSATSYGRFSLGLRGSYIEKYKFQVVKGGVWFEPLGDWTPQLTTGATSGGPVLRYQQVSTLGWDLGDWSTVLIHRYSSRYRDQNPTAGVLPAFRNNVVGSYSLFDLNVTYTGFKNVVLRAGVLNLLNTDPPYTNQTARFQARKYDDRFHNPLGRVFTLAGRYTF
ncbi:MAG: TonB-dependent receptor [Burkholderiaceae bacterium]|nr:TonB-dependent receptor [Burkholderiaceae bacterium]